MEKVWGGVEVEKANSHTIWDVTEICTKSCQKAYESYETNGICPHYHGKYFIGMMLGVLNRDKMESTKCIDVVKEICDLFKKDESEWK